MISTLCSDIWLSFLPGGEDGKFEPELSSHSNGINLLYLLIWIRFKVKSSLSPANGSEEEVFKRVTVTNLVFYQKKLGIEQNNLQKLKCPGGCLEGMLKLRIDWRIICIASVNRSVVESEAYSVAFRSLISIIFLTEFSVASILIISSNQCRRNGRQANLYVKGTVEEQSFPYPHQR